MPSTARSAATAARPVSINDRKRASEVVSATNDAIDAMSDTVALGLTAPTASRIVGPRINGSPGERTTSVMEISGPCG